MKKLSKNTWWLIGGSLVAITGISVYLIINRKKKAKRNSRAQNYSNTAISGTSVSATPKATIKEEPNWNKPFNYNYLDEVKVWLSPKKIKQLSPSKALEYARELKNAKGFFNDNEDIVKTIFAKRLRDKTQVSSLSRAFYATYNKDLWQYLRSFLSDTELKTLVTDPVKRLPNYKLK